MIAIIQDGPIPANHMQKAQRALISEEQPWIFLPNNQLMPIFPRGPRHTLLLFSTNSSHSNSPSWYVAHFVRSIRLIYTVFLKFCQYVPGFSASCCTKYACKSLVSLPRIALFADTRKWQNEWPENGSRKLKLLMEHLCVTEAQEWFLKTEQRRSW